MFKKATFIFHGSLNDFLQQAKRYLPVDYFFAVNPSVKDAIETIGIPHTEVGTITIDQEIITFTYLLNDQDHIVVYPSELTLSNPLFVLDVHLGKLARTLRMLGFDCLYQNDYTDAQIVKIAASRQRIVLTRDVDLLKHKVLPAGYGYWLRSQYPNEQLREVMTRFRLYSLIKPFFRCMNCNGILQSVAKESVIELLEPNTRLYFNEFYRCDTCGNVYWKGSHYEKMLQFVENISGKLPDEV